MITIIRGNEKIVCSKGTYEEQFRHLGYQIASETKGAAKKVAPLKEEKDKKDEEIELEEKLEKKYKITKTKKK